MPPRIDYSKCGNCGKCSYQCGKFVFSYDTEKERVTPSRARECIDCFICMLVCPSGAVSVVRSRGRAL